MVDWHSFFPPGTPIQALPSWRSPRLYLPAQSFLQRWRGSSFYPAFRFRARLYRFLLRIRAATGLAAVRTIRSSDWPLGEFVQDVLPQAVSAVVLVGTPGPAQKITAQLRDENGRVLGYLKCAEKEAARKRLRQECQMLSSIPEGLGPETLRYGSLGNGEALLTSPLSGRQLPPTLPPPEDLIDFSSSPAVLPPMPLAVHPWVRRVRERSELELDPWFEVLEGKNWPVVVQHGDFTPWNLLRRPNGTLGAIDWEYGTLEGFPYLDFIHYMLETSALIYHRTPSRAVEYAVRYLTREPRLVLRKVEARALIGLAAYSAYRKYREDGSPYNAGQRWRRAIWEDSVVCGV